MREGAVSFCLGMPAIPSVSESVMVARDLELARFLNARIHIAHVSTKRSLRIILEAKRSGVKVTCETCPHYFMLSDEEWQRNFSTLLKVNPPLAGKEDVDYVKKCLKGKVIDVIASDHAPHTRQEKDKDAKEAPFGMIGLEFVFSLSYSQLVSKGSFSLKDLSRLLSFSPAKILGFNDRGIIKEGKRADIAIVDINKPLKITEDSIRSLSKNTPFIGRQFKGKVEMTIFKGKVVYKE